MSGLTVRSLLWRTPLPRKLKARAGAAALRRLPAAPVDASKLAVATPTLASLGQGEVTSEEWDAVATQLAELEVPDGTGGVNAGDRRALYQLVRKLRVADVLEIGTHLGASTTPRALALAANAEDGRLTTVDIEDVNDSVTQPWKRYGSSLSPRAALERVGVDDRVTFVRKPAMEFFEQLGDETYDLIFLDGDHAATAVYQEVPAALRRLRPGGYLLLHDFFPHLRPLWPDGTVIPGPWLAIERLRGEGAPVTALPLGELPWHTKQGTNRTSLALVARTSAA